MNVYVIQLLYQISLQIGTLPCQYSIFNIYNIYVYQFKEIKQLTFPSRLLHNFTEVQNHVYILNSGNSSKNS